jgi:glutaredoxin-like protein NrdH
MTITVYEKPLGCFGCKKTKELFDAAGVQFTAVDITTNDQALAYVTDELGYSQVPVVVYEKDGSEDHWSGLNPTKISQVIAFDTTQ